jgi:hypothetical protein
VHVVKLLQKLNIAMFYVLFDGHNFEWLLNEDVFLFIDKMKQILKPKNGGE